MSNSSPFVKNPALERFLRRLPEDVANSFTTEQLQALQTALQSTEWRQHPVDIRLTIPLLWKKFYFVLIAGPDRRSKHRRIYAPVWRPANILFAMGLISLGMLMTIGLFQLKSISLDFLANPFDVIYPTGIPFKPDKESCEDSGRIWRDDQCFDYDHDPNF